MSFFNPISNGEFERKLTAARETEGAVIVDVRAPVEVAEGYIPGAVNIPLNQIPTLDKPKDTPRSGARSERAAKALGKLGYTNVTNLGGILDYSGPLQK